MMAMMLVCLQPGPLHRAGVVESNCRLHGDEGGDDDEGGGSGRLGTSQQGRLAKWCMKEKEKGEGKEEEDRDCAPTDNC